MSGSGAVLRRDEATGRYVYVAVNRMSRPQPAADDCPFCPGGVESPGGSGPYAFDNRWPPVEQGRGEIVVFGPDHRRDLGFCTAAEIRAVLDLWAARGEQQWERPGTRCVLAFENRGAQAGATVPHPHGQLFGLPFLPPLCPEHPPGACPACADSDDELLVESFPGWRVAVPLASPAPYTLRLVPDRHVAALGDLDAAERDWLALALGRAVRRLDALFSLTMPYQMWIPQVRGGHLTVTVAGLLRSPDRLRILGAAELGTGLLFSPLLACRAAEVLRGVPVPQEPQPMSLR